MDAREWIAFGECRVMPGWLLAMVFLVFSPCALGQTDDRVDSAALFDAVTEQARALAQTDYDEAGIGLPSVVRDLDYDAYRSIRFRPDQAIWGDSGDFSVQLFHPGFLYAEPVKMHLVDNGQVRELPFDTAMFRYDGAAADLAGRVPAETGYAGFRLHYPLNRADYDDEFIVFQGASYFRLVGRNQIYGLSARGLAIDTAEPSGEEFPTFRAFWLLRPAADAGAITVLALMDSPSVAGAYRFVISPAEQVSVEVDARLFARRDIAKLGVAPLTSMYAHGDTSVQRPDDFRPRVHDSEGLLARTGQGEWIWRPLRNPRRLRIASLRDEQPGGFGLIQRSRDFDDYLDMEARYEQRPGLWVQPLEGDWGRGGVELVEIPTPSEVNDNIVAYWVPEAPFHGGEERRFRYRLTTVGDGVPGHDGGRVVRTRQGWGAVPGQADSPPPSVRRFVVDFRGGELASLDASHPVEADLSHSAGAIQDRSLQRLPDGKTWRASFRLHPEGDAAVDLRLRLRLRDRVLTETWNYVWYPDELR